MISNKVQKKSGVVFIVKMAFVVKGPHFEFVCLKFMGCFHCTYMVIYLGIPSLSYNVMH